MNDWPTNLTVAPIGEWPGTLTPAAKRQRAMFSAGWDATLDVLDRELYMLKAKNAEMLVAIDASQFRLDGKPRASAVQQHPGVILSFDSSVGHLSYPCDTFDRWRDNVRAIALALEALRKVDRYGVTKRGEQYRGFLAIEATAAPAGFSSAAAAVTFLSELVADEWEGGRVPNGTATDLRRLVRGAQRRTHPDTGGDAATFQRVSVAEAKLRDEGLL